ncbi:MAG: ABC transporter ATP-binding protein [Caldilineae bacterium]|nr:MAG: ABC transporter ATP-binding protein [Caldilineae bacterium]
MLTVQNLNVFYGSLQALHDVSLEVREGEFVTLIGSNGAGKTTLLRTISGLLAPASGEITFRGERLNGLSTHDICERGLIQVPEGRELFPRMSVVDNLDIGAYPPPARRQRLQSREEVFRLLPRLEERRNQDAGTLSGGEQQMLAIGRALMARPSLLMLDEPSLGLAPILVKHIMEILQELNRQGLTILLVSQEVRLALSLADRAYVLENGRIIRSGTGRELLADTGIVSAYLGL